MAEMLVAMVEEGYMAGMLAMGGHREVMVGPAGAAVEQVE